MNSTVIVRAIAALALGIGSVSFAQASDWGDREGRRGGYDRHVVPNAHGGQYQPPHHDYRAQQQPRRHRDGQYNSYERHRDGQYNSHDGQRRYSREGQYRQRDGYAGQYREWPRQARQYRRGDHLPYELRQHRHYVNDWRAHRLYAPPQGYQWVQADSGDYLLVALATGLIANLLLNQ